MLIPSVDIRGGKAVQLVGGKELAIDAGDPLPIARKFGQVGEIAVIDLDGAISGTNNIEQISQLLPHAQCRVGGGIRDVETAVRWLDAGASKVIIGTAATPELLAQLPRHRVIVALDAVHKLPDGDEGQSVEGQVVDHGWRRNTGKSVFQQIQSLKEFAGGFLITFVEREGRMTGIDIETAEEYASASAGCDLIVAGGISSTDEIAMLDSLGIDAQVGMAIYSGKLTLAESYCCCLKSDREDGLWPTVVTNQSGQALGLAYSNLESVEKSLETSRAHYWSRTRGLWQKGKTSGATQRLLSIDLDCDRDALRFVVEQAGAGFCHLPQTTCFGDLPGIQNLERLLIDRRDNAHEGSFTRKLFESPKLLNEKILEEADELTNAQTREDIVHEAADVVFFTLTRLVKEQVSWFEIEKELRNRSLKVTRRN